MHYLVYQITNNINGKIYIGVHQTSDIDDGYMGSGTILKRAYKKYGINSFTKTILCVFDNASDMFAKETELVNENFVSRSDTYNIKVGGQGGWDFINVNGLQLYPGKADIDLKNLDNAKIGYAKYKSNPDNLIATGVKISNSLKTKFDAEGHHWTGKSHTLETKNKLSSMKRGKGLGSDNSNAKKIKDHNGMIFDTVKECASYHGVSTSTIRRWVLSDKFTEIQ